MKKILFLLLMLLSTTAKAQVVNTVCGAKFGSGYPVVAEALKGVYGDVSSNVFYRENDIFYINQTFEGISFTCLKFDFVRDEIRSYLDHAWFFVGYATEEEVLDARAMLITSLGKTFTIEREQSADGVQYVGGKSPLSNTEPGFIIYITLSDDNLPYNLNIEFGPYGYGNN